MSENNQQQDTTKNREYVEQLTQLIGKAKEQDKTELVPALEAALEALKEKNDKGDEQGSGDDFKMSAFSAQDQLLKLAQDVRTGHATLSQRKLAGQHLARLAGKR